MARDVAHTNRILPPDKLPAQQLKAKDAANASVNALLTASGSRMSRIQGYFRSTRTRNCPILDIVTILELRGDQRKCQNIFQKRS